jgi:TPR repeat protein
MAAHFPGLKYFVCKWALTLVCCMFLFGLPAHAVADEALERAAAEGDVNAQYTLGEYLRFGSNDSYKINYVEAFKWYKKAAEAGHIDAQYAVGCMLEEGKGVPEDREEAQKWIDRSQMGKFEKFVKQAENGKPWDQTNMGYFYRDGTGLGYPGKFEPDYSEAMKWFQKAAAGGDWRGMMGIAGLYRDGLGVTQDYKTASEWLQKAAEQGSFHALVRMAYLCRTWQNPGRPDEDVYFWLKAATERMETVPEKISEALVEARGRLDSDVAVKIDARVAEWLEAHPLKSLPAGATYRATAKMIREQDIDIMPTAKPKTPPAGAKAGIQFDARDLWPKRP